MQLREATGLRLLLLLLLAIRTLLGLRVPVCVGGHARRQRLLLRWLLLLSCGGVAVGSEAGGPVLAVESTLGSCGRRLLLLLLLVRAELGLL